MKIDNIFIRTTRIKKILFFIMLVFFCLNVPTLAQKIKNPQNIQAERNDYLWVGGTSSDVSDLTNWIDNSGSAPSALPGADSSGIPYDIVRIGASTSGRGEYEDFILSVPPVLSTTYVSPDGDSYGGWWFVLNNNILSLQNSAYLVLNRDNCNLRNGGKLEVQGRSDKDGPSLVLTYNFRIAENGSDPQASNLTCQLTIKDSGWVQSNPTLRQDITRATEASFIIGTADDPGTMPRGRILIEDNGRLEIKEDPLDVTTLYFAFSNTDTSVNKIIIRDQGELWIPVSDTAVAGYVGGIGPNTANLTVGDPVGLQGLIDRGFITNDQGGQIEMSGTNPTVVRATGVVGVKDNPGTKPSTFALYQNYPNPFNPSTVIKFQIAHEGHVSLSVYNLLGERVAALVNGNLKSGIHNVTFNASNLTSGVYFYRLETNNFSQVKKMLLLK